MYYDPATPIGEGIRRFIDSLLDSVSACLCNLKKYNKTLLFMNMNVIKPLRQALASEKSVKFAYLFGSHARKDTGKLSNFDIAVYLDDRIDTLQCRLRLIEHISKSIGVLKVDLIVLNSATPLLNHQVVKTGVVVKENKRYRIGFEMRSLQEYLDTKHLRNTQLSYMRQHLKEGTYFG